MKKNKLGLVIGILTIITAIGCKKKEETPTPTQGTPPVTNQCSAQVNGLNFSANEFSSGSSGSNFELRFENGSKELYFSCYNSSILPGTYALQNIYDSVAVRASYTENGMTYPVNTGSINISEANIVMETPFTKVRKFVATFNFDTDTISGNYFNIINGSVTYINNY